MLTFQVCPGGGPSIISMRAAGVSLDPIDTCQLNLLSVNYLARSAMALSQIPVCRSLIVQTYKVLPRRWPTPFLSTAGANVYDPGFSLVCERI